MTSETGRGRVAEAQFSAFAVARAQPGVRLPWWRVSGLPCVGGGRRRLDAYARQATERATEAPGSPRSQDLAVTAGGWRYEHRPSRPQGSR